MPQKNFIILSFAILVIMSVYSCKRKTDESHTAPSNAGVQVRPDSIRLKDILLNEQSVISNSRLLNSTMMTADLYEQLSIKKIDSGNISSYKYHIFDTLFNSSHTQVLLIARAYVEENVVWLVDYTDGKLSDYKIVYYDNSEGFLKISAGIKDNTIRITTENDFAEAKNEKLVSTGFYINSSNKIIPRN